MSVNVLLRARGIRRGFEGKQVLDGVDLDILDGEFLAILGPSGCGKTTLFNVIAGFDSNAGVGELTLAGNRITSATPRIGVIFQEGSLFPWYTLKQNLSFGHRLQSMPEDERDETVRRYMEHFGLSGLEAKYPDMLSGGERQRGAVARALINRPQLLLADEPFRALDSMTRLRLQVFLWNEIKERKDTLCFITHDIDEALLISDRIALMSDRPAKILSVYTNTLAYPRKATTVLSNAFLEEKQRFIAHSHRYGVALFPESPETYRQ